MTEVESFIFSASSVEAFGGKSPANPGLGFVPFFPTVREPPS